MKTVFAIMVCSVISASILLGLQLWHTDKTIVTNPGVFVAGLDMDVKFWESVDTIILHSEAYQEEASFQLRHLIRIVKLIKWGFTALFIIGLVFAPIWVVRKYRGITP